MPGPPYRGTPKEIQAVKNEYWIGQGNRDWPISAYLATHLAAIVAVAEKNKYKQMGKGFPGTIRRAATRFNNSFSDQTRPQ